MKDLEIERIIYTGYDKSKSAYKYNVYCEDFVYKFLIEEIKDKESSFFSRKNEYIIKSDFEFVSSHNIVSLCSDKPIRALCDFLKFDYKKFKNDIYVNIDKKHFFDYIKNNIDDYYVTLPIENIFTPNTNRSNSDTICALLDKEYEFLDGDDCDFNCDVISKILSQDKKYIQPFLSELTRHLFNEFLTDEEKKEKEDSKRGYLALPDNFERKFKSYDDEIEFKRTYEDFEEENYSIEKLEFTIKHNIHYKDPYKNYDSETMATASTVIGAMASLFVAKKAIKFINDK